MTITHAQYVEQQSKADPDFARDYAEARAELRLAIELAGRRVALGLTQADVATAMAVRQPAIARYERAGRTPLATSIWRFCDALDAEITFGPRYSIEVRSAGVVIDETPRVKVRQETITASSVGVVQNSQEVHQQYINAYGAETLRVGDALPEQRRDNEYALAA